MTATATPTYIWSDEQDIIYYEFEHGTGHVVIKAYAGTGKTTTGIEGIRRAPEQSIVFCAFNKRIEQDIAKKLARAGNTRAVAKTIHAIGFAICRKFLDNLKVDSSRGDLLTDAVCDGPLPLKVDVLPVPLKVKRLVTRLHTLGREMAPYAVTMGDLTDIAIQYECEPETQWQHLGYNAAYVEQKALEAMALAATVQSGGIIDYTDMLYLPVVNGWVLPQYDLVVVDELQDVNVTQKEIVKGVCKPGGRIIGVGDDNQAIYTFRGADSGGIDRLKAELDAKELGLRTTYRCAKRIVREANRYVADFKAGPDNPEGEVRYISHEQLTLDAEIGCFILSRINAPLVSIAMKLLKMGKRTRIAGKDIGAGLKALIRRFDAKSVPDLLRKIAAWEEREIVRVKAQMGEAKTEARKNTLQAKIDGIVDQAEMLTSLTDGAKNVGEITTRIDHLFSDDGLGDKGVITCSSVHKAKGLEADTVYILADTIRSHNQEENNIAYVAITRAKQTLVWVGERAA